MKSTILVSLTIALLVSCSGPTEPREAAETPPPEPALFEVDPSTAASITGKAAFRGTKPVRKPINMAGEEADCLKAHDSPPLDEEVIVNDNGTLRNVFVYVKTGLEGKEFAPVEGAVQIDQRGCVFRPHVFGIRTGQTLEVINSDPFSHNIHPVPKNNREWNQQQAPGSGNLERTFPRPEVMIPIKCNIHSWMRAYAGVVDHPYFAVSGEDGAFELNNLPPGNYTIEAWHEKYGIQQQQLTLAASQAGAVEFTFPAD